MTPEEKEKQIIERQIAFRKMKLNKALIQVRSTALNKIKFINSKWYKIPYDSYCGDNYDDDNSEYNTRSYKKMFSIDMILSNLKDETKKLKEKWKIKI